MHRVTAVVPAITERADLLPRALASVARQSHPVTAISVRFDHDREGAGPNRTKALAAASTEWVAFLDDDDEWHPDHLAVLAGEQEATGADVVWPWFVVHGGVDPFPMHRGRQWDVNDPHIFPICALVRREAILDAGAVFPAPNPADPGAWEGDDYPFWKALARAGARFHHTPRITWTWHHNARNTSGVPANLAVAAARR